MYSGLAEVYGVHQSLQVLQQYATQYPIIYHPNTRATVYCDNLGVIDRINGTSPEQQPRDMIRDKYPIFKEIEVLQTNLKPIRLTFTHVDGHLDTK